MIALIQILGFVIGILLTAVPLHAATKYVCQADGNDADNGSTAALAKATINAGIGVMAAGDTLEICAGTYPELLVGSVDGSLTVPANVLAVQPGTKIIPSGASCGAPTTLVSRAGATVIISPVGIEYPGGGGIYTGFATSNNLTFDALVFRRSTTSGSASGVSVGNATCVNIVNNELDGSSVTNRFPAALIKSGDDAQSLVIRNNHIHHSGTGCDITIGSPPCPHGIYVCGDNHLIEENLVTHSGHTGVQVSCESGGITGVTIRRNHITDSAQIGIGVGCTGCIIAANVIERSGAAAIRPTGGAQTIVYNTIVDWTHDPLIEDPFGIFYDAPTGAIIKNNLILKMPDAFHVMQERDFTFDTSKANHNACEFNGNAACTVVDTTPGTFVVDLTGGDYRLTSTSPARAAGVAITGVTTDFLGTTYGSPPDIGAYAFSSGPGFPNNPTGVSLSGNSTITFLSNPTGTGISGAATPLFLANPSALELSQPTAIFAGNPSGVSISGNTTITFLSNPSGIGVSP